MVMIVTAEVPKLGFEFFITFQDLVDPLLVLGRTERLFLK